MTRWVAAIGFVRAQAALGQAGGGGREGPTAGVVGEPDRSELVRATLAALRRDYTRNRDRPTRRVAPLLLDDIARILAAGSADAGTWTGRVRERRDSALLLMGFAGAFRRCELAGLVIGDIQHKPGVGLHIRDPQLPVFRAIRGHDRLADVAMTGAAIHKALRRNLTHAGYSPDDIATFGTHSARAGFVTQGLLNGATPHSIMRQTGHASPAMIEVHAREHAPSVNNAVTSLGI